MSAEHPVSKSALREVIAGDKLRASGHRFPTSGAAGKVIGLNSATKRVLCARHNSALSSLDAVGAALTRAHADLMIHLNEGKPGDYHRLFNGYDIERWMLKVLCAQQHGERIPGSLDLERWAVPANWLGILFYGEPFPPGAGLYLPKHQLPELRSQPGICTTRTYVTAQRTEHGLPLVGSTVERLAGIYITILGVPMELLMERPSNPADYVYRPRMRRFPDPATGRGAYLHFGWDEHPPTFAGKRAHREENGFGDGMANHIGDVRTRQRSVKP